MGKSDRSFFATPHIKTRRLGSRLLMLPAEQKQKQEDIIQQHSPTEEVYEIKTSEQRQHSIDVLNKLHALTELDLFDQELNDQSCSPRYQEKLQEMLFTEMFLAEKNIERIKILLRRIDPKFSYLDPNTKRPIEIVADAQDWACVSVFAEYETDETDNPRYSSVLTRAVAAGEISIVAKLRASNAKVNVSIQGYLPLYLAAENQDIEMIKLLLREGANPDEYAANSPQGVRKAVYNNNNLPKKAQILELFETYPLHCVREYIGIAEQREKNGELDLAIANYKKILAILPHHAEAHENLIKLYEKQQKAQLTIPHYEELIQCLLTKKQTSQLNAESALQLAELCYKFANILFLNRIKNSIFQSLELIGTTIELCKDRTDQRASKIYFDTCEDTGWISFGSENWSDALAWFSEALQRSQGRSSIHLLSGCAQCAQKLGRLPEASDYFLRMLQARKREYESKSYEAASSVSPTDDSYISNMIYAIYITPAKQLLDRGDFLGALKILDVIMPEYPRHSGICEIFYRVDKELRFIANHPTNMTGKDLISFLKFQYAFFKEKEESNFTCFLYQLREHLKENNCFTQPMFQKTGVLNGLEARLMHCYPDNKTILNYGRHLWFLAKHAEQIKFFLSSQEPQLIMKPEGAKQFAAIISSHYHVPQICVRMIHFALMQLPDEVNKYSQQDIVAFKKMAEKLLTDQVETLSLCAFSKMAKNFKEELSRQTTLKAITSLDTIEVAFLFDWIDYLTLDIANRMSLVNENRKEVAQLSQAPCSFHNANNRKKQQDQKEIPLLSMNKGSVCLRKAE